MFCSEHCLKTDEVKARVPRTPSQPSSSRPQSPPVAVALPHLVPVSLFVPWLLKGQEDEQSLVFYHLQQPLHSLGVQEHCWDLGCLWLQFIEPWYLTKHPQTRRNDGQRHRISAFKATFPVG